MFGKIDSVNNSKQSQKSSKKEKNLQKLYLLNTKKGKIQQDSSEFQTVFYKG